MAGRGEQIELLVAHATMMSRPIGMSTRAPLPSTFPDQNLPIDLSAERLTNNVRN